MIFALLGDGSHVVGLGNADRCLLLLFVVELDLAARAVLSIAVMDPVPVPVAVLERASTVIALAVDGLDLLAPMVGTGSLLLDHVDEDDWEDAMMTREVGGRGTWRGRGVVVMLVCVRVGVCLLGGV